MTELKHPFVRRIILHLGKKARSKFEGQRLQIILFELAAWYGSAELYGLWETCKLLYALRIKPILSAKKQ